MINSMGAMEINEEKRDELQDILRVYQDYKLGLEKTKDFIHYLKENDGCDYDFNFAYYMMSLFYRRLENFKCSISNLKKSIKYPTSMEETMKNKWALGQLYHECGYIEKAMKLYQECFQYYEKRKQQEALAGLLCNMGDASHNELLIRKAINIYKKTIVKNINDRKNVLQEMYKLLDSTITYNINNF